METKKPQDVPEIALVILILINWKINCKSTNIVYSQLAPVLIDSLLEELVTKIEIMKTFTQPIHNISKLKLKKVKNNEVDQGELNDGEHCSLLLTRHVLFTFLFLKEWRGTLRTSLVIRFSLG